MSPRAAARPAAPEEAVHAAAATALAERGIRYTTHRRTLVGVLRGAGQPLTIPQLVAAAAGVPQSSVYRTMAVLDDAGIVHRMPGTDDFARYELAEHLMGHHHHLVCSRCGRVDDIELPRELESELDGALRRVARRRGFSPTGHRLDLLGRCRDCSD